MKPIYHALEVSGLSHDGRGIAKLSNEHDSENSLPLAGKSCFIADTVPGDIVTARILDQQNQFAEAQLVGIEQASGERSEPFCQYYGECGGCQLQHLNIDSQREWKAQNFFNQLQKAVNCETCEFTAPLTSEDKGYRRRARLALEVDKKSKQARFGFRKRNSNELIDIDSCPLLTDGLNQALQQARPQFLAQASRSTKEFTLVEADNGIFGLSENAEKPFYRLDASNLTLHFPHSGFIQVNKTINEQMIAQALNWLQLTDKDKVLDLFCGVGNFTLPLAQQSKKAVGIEGLSELVETAQQNAADNHLHNSEFFQADLFDEVSGLPWFRKQKYHKILLDPGRPGAFELCKQLGKLNADKIVYVSCNASTLIRDVKELEKQGYQLRKATFMDMFAHTTHAEVMVLLEKAQKQKTQRDKRIASKKQMFKF